MSEQTDTFDWAGLLIDVTCKHIEEGDLAAAAYLRTRIEAAFVPVEDVTAERGRMVDRIEEWERQIAEATARAEAAEAECLEQARLLGMSGERELALRAELERLTAQLATARESERAAVIEGAGEVEKKCAALAVQIDPLLLGGPDARLLNQAAATIAALKAEIERLTEREVQAKLDGVRLGIEASAVLLERDDGFGEWWDAAQFVRSELDAEAIAKGEG